MDQATLDLIVKFLPVIGAILGSVATLITTYLLRNSGKMIVNVSSASVKLWGSDLMGGQEEKKTWSRVERVECEFEVDFYNSSDTPKSLRATYIGMFERDTKESYTSTIYLPGISNSPTLTYDSLSPNEMHILNLPSKEMVHLKLKVYYVPVDMKPLQGKVDFFFQGKYPNGRTFRKKLVTQEFE
jgi:hypothetical protein